LDPATDVLLTVILPDPRAFKEPKETVPLSILTSPVLSLDPKNEAWAPPVLVMAKLPEKLLLELRARQEIKVSF
jgi:hypothetical protein